MITDDLRMSCNGSIMKGGESRNDDKRPRQAAKGETARRCLRARHDQTLLRMWPSPVKDGESIGR